MIDLYSWPTPNGFKVSIMLEECGLPYTAHGIDIGSGDQFSPEFLAISPNNKIPAIVDHDGPGGGDYALFESGAILMYLAEKTGQFWPQDHPAKWDTVEWLMWQMGGFGPMLGQAHHFRQYAPETIAYAVDRYTNEAGRLYRVLDKRLAEAEWLAGDRYTIADIATFPWSRSIERQGHALADFPHVERWFNAIEARPAVQRGLGVLADRRKEGPLTPEAREAMFGATQYQKR
jgi:GST-like protein